ncbi:glycerol-3-phosphate acyltransferase 3-like [Lissotriton helveticus]
MEIFVAVILHVLPMCVAVMLVLIMVPSLFGLSLGISELYMKILVKTLQWATVQIQEGVTDKQTFQVNGIIQRDLSPMENEIVGLRKSRSDHLRSRNFDLSDVFYFSKKGFEAIVEDEVTQRFSSEELASWNLLTRTNNFCQFLSLHVTMIWVLGVIIRYGILLPLCISLVTIGMSFLIVGATRVGQLPNSSFKSWLGEMVHLICARICARALSSAIQYHNRENKPKKGAICVANHTSAFDLIILANDGCYSMVGQAHRGLAGFIQRTMVKACPHVWFERSEMKDRHILAKRLQEHVADKNKLPILIFPEGTCITNTSVMMFKKGSFEIGGTIYPVAIKYGPQFGDAFWNSSKFSMGIDLPWDGGLKRYKVKGLFREEQQKKYSKIIGGNETPTTARNSSTLSRSSPTPAPAKTTSLLHEISATRSPRSSTVVDLFFRVPVCIHVPSPEAITDSPKLNVSANVIVDNVDYTDEADYDAIDLEIVDKSPPPAPVPAPRATRGNTKNLPKRGGLRSSRKRPASPPRKCEIDGSGELAKLIEDLTKEINQTKDELLKVTTKEEWNQILADTNLKLDEYTKEINDRKLRKFKRDTTDYCLGEVYTWAEIYAKRRQQKPNASTSETSSDGSEYKRPTFEKRPRTGPTTQKQTGKDTTQEIINIEVPTTSQTPVSFLETGSGPVVEPGGAKKQINIETVAQNTRSQKP